MLGKTDKNFSQDGGTRYVMFSDDGGTTWIPGLCDSDGRIIAKQTNDAGTVINPGTEDKQDDIITELKVVNSLVPAAYDYISLSYTGTNLTGTVFKTGGSGGTTVSTLVLAYDGSDNLTSVTQS